MSVLFASNNRNRLSASRRCLTEEQIQQKTEGRFNTFIRIAKVAGGNQVVLTEFSALGLVTVELYDRYMGLLIARAQCPLLS